MRKAEPSLNNIPTDLSAYTASSSSLPIERTVSSIPKSSVSRTGCPIDHSATSSSSSNASSSSPASAVLDEDSKWIYPSPQQFQAALSRKGKEAPEESVEMMVSIHNFLNEQAWFQVKKWEDPISAVGGDGREVELARFEGRPQDLSPKARFHIALAKLFPNAYSAEPPFDRHDWYIRRPWDGSIHRYVIDYYSCPEDEQGCVRFYSILISRSSLM